jgi:formate dehydrogenase major subunit
MWISQHVHGTDNARCLIALALLCGQIGRPGTGLHPLRGQNNVQGASDAGLIPMFLPDYYRVDDPVARADFERYWGTKLDPVPGLTVVEIMDAIKRRSIRGLYIMGENPAMSDPDVQHAREALAKLDHLVVQEIFLTETARHADVILPSTAFPEKTGTFTNTDRRVQIGRQALQPPGDARQDWWIVQELARRIGLDWNYQHPSEIYEELRGCMPSLRGISWERLERQGAVTYPCPAEDDPGQEIIFGDGFPTPNQRGKLVPIDVSPPDELPDDAYPMILTTGRLLEHWHTGAMTRRATVLDRIEPEAAVHMAPADLDRLHARPGDRLRVTTRRGSIELAARSDRDVPAGLIFIPFCFVEAAANLLTNPALDPFGKIPEFKFCAAKVEAMPGSAPIDG